jgi:UDP-N-acetyl-2-amino-2-deoxyglucuronate dehydrogenase
VNTLRFGVIGAGMIAGIHAQALRQATGASLSGVMDRGKGKAAIIAPECPPLHADDLERFIAREDIDAITIASPSGAHLEAAVLAARYGKHCLVEKPVEVTLPRIDDMIAAHRNAGTTLGGIFNTRYTDGAQLLKRTVDAGRFGRMTFASAVGPWWREQGYYDDSAWKGSWALDGGGALMNQGIHSIDLLQWLVGEPVSQVSGRIATLAHEGIEVEDTGAAQLVFANGALGTLACTTSMWPGHFRTITIAGTDGTAVLADGNLLEWRFRDETAQDDDIRRRLLQLPGAGVGASDPSAGVDADGHCMAVEAFCEAVTQGTTPEVDGVEARKAVAIIRAVYESSASGGNAVAVDNPGDSL